MDEVQLPTQIETSRLLLRRPKTKDVQAIFEGYAHDVDVTKFMSWPQHETIGTTEEVVANWIEQWTKESRGGPYVIVEPGGELIGCTGFEIQNRYVASTGYVFAKKHWGMGYATEALNAVIKIGKGYGIQRLQAYCHHEHRRSARVLEKCGFEFEGTLRNFIEFPNLSPGEVTDVLMYAWIPRGE